MSARPLLAFDVGNTRIKAGWFEDASLVRFAAITHRTQELSELLDQSEVAIPEVAVISTVRPEVSDRLLLELGRRGIGVELILKSDGALFQGGFLDHDLSTPETTGIDRVLSALAALQRLPGRSVVVVDAGSAITVNLSSPPRTFRGGAILPGFRLMAEALHHKTAQLPWTSFDQLPDAIGRSTAAAIQAGIFHSACAGVDRIIDLANTGGDAAVFVTGGDADLLSTGLRTPHSIEPHLVLEGLALVAARRLQI